MNNPIRFIDPDGMQVPPEGGAEEGTETSESEGLKTTEEYYEDRGEIWDPPATAEEAKSRTESFVKNLKQQDQDRQESQATGRTPMQISIERGVEKQNQADAQAKDEAQAKSNEQLALPKCENSTTRVAKPTSSEQNVSTKKDREIYNKSGEKALNQSKGINKAQDQAKKQVKGQKQTKIQSTKKSDQNLKRELKNIKNIQDAQDAF